ncbi:MAG: putative para-aminobenzoate synthase component, partial [Friedmanniella sp.]|nr:putative para-aminobenzoate synthase component [Friedmanniella sp.]
VLRLRTAAEAAAHLDQAVPSGPPFDQPVPGPNFDDPDFDGPTFDGPDFDGRDFGGRDFDGLGGGWLVGLGYADDQTSLAFHDSLLRWRPGTGWWFETLGLPGREAAVRTALTRARNLLATAQAAPPTPSEPTRGGADPALFTTGLDPDVARDRYLAAVEAVTDGIHRGDYYQLNLCTRLSADLDRPAPEIFAAVADRLRPTYGVLLTRPGGAEALAGFSPELFLRLRDGEVVTAPIKGTAPRLPGETDSRLRSSTKDAAENIMITDLMRNDLSRVCRPGTVAVSSLLDLEAHPGVWHLVSTVTGRLRDGVGVGEVLAQTFPPGSVTGAPKDAARAAIALLEPESRGAYTGAVGFVSPYGGAELNVAIRTFELSGGRAELGVGGGITVDSVPAQEWAECLHKAAPLVAAAGRRLDPRLALPERPAVPADVLAAGVFESVLVQDGRPVRLDAHLARLDRSCRELFGQGLEPDLGRRVARLDLAGPTRQVLRVRVTPAGPGLRTDLELAPLGARVRHCTLVVASRPSWSWRHKWSRRAALLEAEREVGTTVGGPLVLPYFLSPGTDTVTETSRGNLVIQGPDAVWRTAPLDDDVLPGVTRREAVVALGDLGERVRVERVPQSGLRDARAAFTTSSLSGAVAVTAIDGHPLAVPPGLLDRLNLRLRVS